MKAGGGEIRRRRRSEGRRGQWRGRGGFILYLDEMVGESTVLVQELLVLQEHGHQDLGRHNIGRRDFGHFPPSRLLFILFLVRRQQPILHPS